MRRESDLAQNAVIAFIGGATITTILGVGYLILEKPIGSIINPQDCYVVRGSFGNMQIEADHCVRRGSPPPDCSVLAIEINGREIEPNCTVEGPFRR